MFFFFFENDRLKIELNSSPAESDIAMVSVDDKGNIDSYNYNVLRNYGYSSEILKQLKLESGFAFFQLNGKPILFVVTAGSVDAENDLRINFTHAITANSQVLTNKTILISLIGSVSSSLNYNKSFDIILNVLKGLTEFIIKFNCKFIISIPNDTQGSALYNQLDKEYEISKLKSELDRLNPPESAFAGEKKSIAQPNSTKTDLNDEMKLMIEKTHHRFYLVGSNWGSEDHSDRFYSEGIWENGYGEEKFGDRVNAIREGDILFNKSTYAKHDGSNYLRIKGIGIVTRNPKNSSLVFCNWISKNLKVDIEDMSNYRDTISSPSPVGLIAILNGLDNSSLKGILNYISKDKQFSSFSITPENLPNDPTQENEVEKKTNIMTLAGLLSDVDTGIDHLDITKDVNAFARVMAARSFEPPLAVALLGKWGSGKSFFMRKLKESIQLLSSNNPANAFCEGIAHVHFNAWSYMDANLWASVVTRIFEGLQEYITADNLASQHKKEIEEKLTKNLNIAKEELSTLEKQSKSLEIQIEKLIQDKVKAETDLQEKIDKIRLQSAKSILDEVDQRFELSQRINDALASNATFINTSERLEKIVTREYWQNPGQIVKELKSASAFIKTFFFGDRWWKNILWIICILLAIYIVPIAVNEASFFFENYDFRLSQRTWTILTLIGATLTRAAKTYQKLKKLIAPFWKIKEDYEKEKENALFEFKQKEKALLLEIENKKNEVNAISDQISKTTVIRSGVEFKLNNALSTEALFAFIEKRANSEDYKKHLGIVSTIRKDFEVLNNLLVDHSAEAEKNKEGNEFRAMFERPLKRIILYIDDLDRCPEDRVVEVLEAVNLLMAFPLFVVVVGVDPRWVKNALLKKHVMQFTGQIGQSLNEHIEVIEAASYLEKIFQVPFHLKEATDESIKNMIEKFAVSIPTLSSEPQIPYTDEDENREIHSLLENMNTNEPEPNELVETILFESSEKIVTLAEEKIDALKITPDEITEIKKLTPIIGTNPRAIKRFINIYRIVKTHEDFNYQNNDALTSVMFLLALSIGNYKKVTGDFEKLISIPAYSHHTLKSLKANFPELCKEIEHNQSIMKLTYKDLDEHYHFVKRFTFKNI